ncbi:MAG: Tim44 domain-containing protein [Rhodospirillales bacterium]|nr:Tim44 domain-containing protein [Alphaproteobacteria bacterium]MCB9986600.1 Tim44 domain-containing protein [Rhodospirillales bacterium]USO06870.1 MAG: Tim44 domain-containing protein [Rhodospirillales bacterium]
MNIANIPADILVYAAIAVVLLVWLRGVLGTRSGAERQRPNPFAVPADAGSATGKNVETALPRGAPPSSGTPLDATLVRIALADRAFDPARFVENAKQAFTMVVTAFAKADRRTLRDLLSPDVYRSFDSALAGRERAGQTAEAEVLSVLDAKIIDAALDGKTARVTLRIRAEETYALIDSAGKTVAGNADRVVIMTDVWTFARDVKSGDPRWFLSETRDDVKEDDGMTLPEAGTAA